VEVQTMTRARLKTKEIERLTATLIDAEWVGYYFGLQRALNMKRLPAEFVAFLDHEMREVESKLPPGTIESWPKENSHARTTEE
jgi:hypothetical protein